MNNGIFWEYLFLGDASSKLSEESIKNPDDDENSFMKDSNRPETETAKIHADIAFDCPPVWSNPIELKRSAYLLRYPPTGRKTVQYYKAKVDFFAKNTQVDD